VTVPQVLLADRYRLVKVIASGGMGVVWEAWDERLQRTVAIKQLHTLLGIPEDEAELAKRRAMREARIAARLDHPHAVTVIDAVEHDGKPCLVMPYLSSTPLSAVLRERGSLPVGEAARIGAQVASALAAAHRLGIIHRDVKPGNVLITADGAAHLSDFGISHSMGDATLTMTGALHGTPAYLAPEVARGGEATFASDVFSLGSTLYAMVEGEPPFGLAPNSLVVLQKVAAAQVQPPRHAGALTPFLLRMLAENPAARPTMEEAAAFLARLDPDAAPQKSDAPVAILPGSGTTPREPVPAPSGAPDGAPSGASGGSEPGSEPGSAPPRRRPLVAAVGGAALVAVVITVAAVSGGMSGLFDRSPTGGEVGAGPSAGTTAAPEASPSARSPQAAASDPGPGTTQEPDAPQEPDEPDDDPAADPDAKEPDRADQLASAVTDYYALMPDDTDAGWPMMTGDYRQSHAGGKASYEGFWDDVAQVRVSEVRPQPPDRAEATLTYEFDDGRVVVERTAFWFEEQGGTLRIAGTEVLSSRPA